MGERTEREDALMRMSPKLRKKLLEFMELYGKNGLPQEYRCGANNVVSNHPERGAPESRPCLSESIRMVNQSTPQDKPTRCLDIGCTTGKKRKRAPRRTATPKESFEKGPISSTGHQGICRRGNGTSRAFFYQASIWIGSL